MNLYAATAIVNLDDHTDIQCLPIMAMDQDQLKLVAQSAIDMGYKGQYIKGVEIQAAPFPKKIMDSFMISHYAEYWENVMRLALAMNRIIGNEEIENTYFTQLGISSNGARLLMIKDKTIVGTYHVPSSLIDGSKSVEEWHIEYQKKDSKWHTQDS